jgi:hypothetical protein
MRIPYADFVTSSCRAVATVGGSYPTGASSGPHRLGQPHFLDNVERRAVDPVIPFYRTLTATNHAALC